MVINKKRCSKVTNAFLNAVELSEQECAYLVLRLALHQASRACIFVPTSPSTERVTLLKTMADLAELEAQDTNSEKIASTNIVDRLEY